MKFIGVVALIVGGLFLAVAGIAACRLSSKISRQEEKEKGRDALFAPDDAYSLREEDRRIGVTEDPPVEGDAT